MIFIQLVSICKISTQPRHLPDMLRHHPDTPQKHPYFTYMRPLGERVIYEYHDIYSKVFKFPDNCLTQTSARHAQTLSINCQTVILENIKLHVYVEIISYIYIKSNLDG